MKTRYYGHGVSAEEITVNGIEYRGTIPTVNDRETGKPLPLGTISIDARDTIVQVLNEAEDLAQSRLAMVDAFSEIIAAVIEWQKSYAPENEALTQILAGVQK